MWFFWKREPRPATPPTRADPLDHPALRAMSPRELADLPLSPFRGLSAVPGAGPSPAGRSAPPEHRGAA